MGVALSILADAITWNLSMQMFSLEKFSLLETRFEPASSRLEPLRDRLSLHVPQREIYFTLARPVSSFFFFWRSLGTSPLSMKYLDF